MKTFKKVLRGILTFLLIICIGLLFVNLHLKDMLDDIIKETMKTEISSPITSILKNYNLIDHSINNEQITEIILQDEQINKLYDQYSTTIINGMTDEKELDQIDLDTNIQNIIKNNQNELQEKLGVTITDEQIEQFSQEVANSNAIKEQMKKTIKSVKNQLSNEEKTLLKTYHLITSKNFKLTLIVLIIIIILMIALLYPSIYRPLFNVGLATTITSLLTFILIPIFKSIIDYYFQEQLNILKEVKTTTAILHTTWMLGLGIILFILYYTIKYFIKKNHETT